MPIHTGKNTHLFISYWSRKVRMNQFRALIFLYEKGLHSVLVKKAEFKRFSRYNESLKNFRPKFLVAIAILRQCPHFFQCFSVFYTKYCKNTWNQWNKWKEWHGKAEVFQAGIYLLKVNNRNSRTKYES